MLSRCIVYIVPRECRRRRWGARAAHRTFHCPRYVFVSDHLPLLHRRRLHRRALRRQPARGLPRCARHPRASPAGRHARVQLLRDDFRLPAGRPAHTRRVRIFTPGGEMPFAGHPTVGTAHVLAAIGDIPLTGDTTDIVFEEKVGPVPVRDPAEERRAGVRAALVGQAARGRPPAARSRDALADGARASTPATCSTATGRRSRSRCGLPFLFVPLRDRDAVARARRAARAVGAHARRRVGDGAVRLRDGRRARRIGRSRADVRARASACPEDPATGSACAALAGYLAARDRAARDGTLRWSGRAGLRDGPAEHPRGRGRRGRRAVTAVRVGGATVLVCEGTDGDQLSSRRVGRRRLPRDSVHRCPRCAADEHRQRHPGVGQ